MNTDLPLRLVSRAWSLTASTNLLPGRLSIAIAFAGSCAIASPQVLLVLLMYTNFIQVDIAEQHAAAYGS